MREDEAYMEIAERFILSCDKSIKCSIDVQEVIGFKAYHAFESLAGAYNSHHGYHVPTSHVKKINAFVSNSNRDTSVGGYNIAILAMVLSSMRNKYLYPDLVCGIYKTPKDQLSMTDAKKIVSRVKGIMKNIKKNV